MTQYNCTENPENGRNVMNLCCAEKITELPALSSGGDEIVRFNVGGEIFQVRKETLLSEPGTIFCHILNGCWNVSKGADGAIFIDRDPRYTHFSWRIFLF